MSVRVHGSFKLDCLDLSVEGLAEMGGSSLQSMAVPGCGDGYLGGFGVTSTQDEQDQRLGLNIQGAKFEV